MTLRDGGKDFLKSKLLKYVYCPLVLLWVSYSCLFLSYYGDICFFLLIFKSSSKRCVSEYSLAAAAAAKLLLSWLTPCNPINGSPQSPRPWDSPGKNTGVGCHFLLQCMKVKSESEVAQSCPTLHDPTDCSLPGSSVHRIFQAGVLEWVAISFSNAWKWKWIPSVVSNSSRPHGL